MSTTDAIVDTLRGRILRGLKAGTLIAGARLPSTRELSDEFRVDHRAILAAYRALATEGLIDIRERGGAYVAHPEGRGNRHSLPASWATDVITDAYLREIPIAELAGVFRRSIETLRLRAVVISANEDQAAQIANELAADLGLIAEGVSLSSARSDSRPSLTLRRADLFVTPIAHAQEVAEMAARLRKQSFAVELRPEFVAGEWSMLLRQPVWAIVGSVEFGALLERAFAKVKGAGNLHILVHERDDLSVIPEGAPVYVTHRVREALADTELNGKVLPPDRVIAASSMRPILDYVVHANVQAAEALRSAYRRRQLERRNATGA